MTFAIICIDKKNSLEKRLQARSEHIDYLKALGSKLLMAGPILNKKNQPEGSIIVINSENKEEIHDFIKNDPYKKVKLFSKVKIIKFKKVF